MISELDRDLIITVKNDAKKVELVCEKGNYTIWFDMEDSLSKSNILIEWLVINHCIEIKPN